MSTDIEKLPRLIAHAAATLAKASTAAEVLEARDQADVAYTAAKVAARMSKIRDAHDTILTACRKTMADALVIEARAQCRLADEYDAAQERGDVAKQSPGRPKSVPNKNDLPTANDVGLTRKQVHEARTVRDAEKAKPGIVRRAVDERLEAGEEPTRADVKRALKNGGAKGGNKTKPRAVRSPKAAEREERVAVLNDAGLTAQEISAEIGLGLRAVHQALEHVEIRREAAAEIDPATLSLSAQDKLKAAIRDHQRKLDADFERRVRDEIRRRMDEIILPHWKQLIEQAKQLYSRRKALMDKDTFNTIRRGLHPDSRHGISDKKLGEAFDAFMALEKFLLNEKDSPTGFGDLPSSAADWDRMKMKRSTKRTTPSNIRVR